MRVNNMFGSVLFVSDDPGEYDAEQKKMLMRAFAPFDEKVTAAYLTGSEHIIVTTVKDGAEKEYSFDLAEGKFAVKERK